MTTIVCNRTGMAADKKISEMPVFTMSKLFRVGDSIFGIAGSVEQCLRFIEWRKSTETKPTFSEGAAFSALELTHDGKIKWWGAEMIPVPIDDDFYAIGTGAPYALGAMSNGASLKQSVLIASRYDTATGSDVQLMTLRAKK